MAGDEPPPDPPEVSPVIPTTHWDTMLALDSVRRRLGDSETQPAITTVSLDGSIRDEVMGLEDIQNRINLAIRMQTYTGTGRQGDPPEEDAPRQARAPSKETVTTEELTSANETTINEPPTVAPPPKMDGTTKEKESISHMDNKAPKNEEPDVPQPNSDEKPVPPEQGTAITNASGGDTHYSTSGHPHPTRAYDSSCHGR